MESGIYYYLSNIFNGCTKFNQPLNNWHVDFVTDMSNMFMDVAILIKLNDWNVINVTNMKLIVIVKFNQPLNLEDVSNVTTMRDMFYGCENFNQPLNNWD